MDLFEATFNLIGLLLNSWIAILLIGVVAALLRANIYVINQWQKAVIVRLGNIIGTWDKGLHLKIPFLDRVYRYDMRTFSMTLSGQTCITKDNIPVSVDAVMFIKIADAEQVITTIKDYREALDRKAHASIRTIIGRHDLDDLLEHRDVVANELQKEIDDTASDWGIDVPSVELQDISLPDDMKRAFAVQAEAEREARAVIIKANAELSASVKLAEAAKNLDDPKALQLRFLQTLNDVSKDQSNTIVLALPIETLTAMGPAGALSAANLKVMRQVLEKLEQEQSPT